MSPAIFSSLCFELISFCKVAHLAFTSPLARSLSPLVLFSNSLSSLSFEPSHCSMSLASYTRSSTTPSRTASSNLYVCINSPNTCTELFLSFFKSGVPVKPIKIASGISIFIASCSLPDCVLWHSSTNTTTLPFTSNFPALRFISSRYVLMVPSSLSSSAPFLPNLCTSEHMSEYLALFNFSSKSAPLFVL